MKWTPTCIVNYQNYTFAMSICTKNVRLSEHQVKLT